MFSVTQRKISDITNVIDSLLCIANVYKYIRGGGLSSIFLYGSVRRGLNNVWFKICCSVGLRGAVQRFGLEAARGSVLLSAEGWLFILSLVKVPFLFHFEHVLALKSISSPQRLQ